MSPDPAESNAPPPKTTAPIPPLPPPVAAQPPVETWPPPPPQAPGYAPYAYPPPYPPFPPYTPYPQYPGPMPYYPGPMAPSTSYWAIASLVCALGGFALVFVIGFVFPLILLLIIIPFGAILAVICGHIALVDIARSRGRFVGRGMALAGLIIGYVIIALGLLFGILVLAGIIIHP